jgi:glyoxylase-like metal-dependent hydrolase (beta-lactamase superfamily II)
LEKVVLDITEVADGVFRFKTPVSFMTYAPTVYLIRESAGVLLEPGPSINIPYIHEAMDYLGMEALDFIIPTHVHMDHAGGAGALAQLFPQSVVVVHPRGAKHAVDPSKLAGSVKMVWGEDYEARFGPITPVPESQIKIAEDGEIIRVGERELQVVYAPGHAPHHLVVFDRKVKGLFCGEALGFPGNQLPTVAPVSFTLDTYLDTIERLRHLGLGVEKLFYSHGSVEPEPDMRMGRAVENARLYGDMILEALRKSEELDDISRKVGEHIFARYGLEMEKSGLDVIVEGYRIYFSSRNLI